MSGDKIDTFVHDDWNIVYGELEVDQITATFLIQRKQKQLHHEWRKKLKVKEVQNERRKCQYIFMSCLSSIFENERKINRVIWSTNRGCLLQHSIPRFCFSSHIPLYIQRSVVRQKDGNNYTVVFAHSYTIRLNIDEFHEQTSLQDYIFYFSQSQKTLLVTVIQEERKTLQRGQTRNNSLPVGDIDYKRRAIVKCFYTQISSLQCFYKYIQGMEQITPGRKKLQKQYLMVG